MILYFMNCLCFSLNSSQSDVITRRILQEIPSRLFPDLAATYSSSRNKDQLMFQISLFHFVMCIYQFLRIVCLDSRSRLSGPLPLWSCSQSWGFQPPSFQLRCTEPPSPVPPCTLSQNSCPDTADPFLDFCHGRAPFRDPFLERVLSPADVEAEVVWVQDQPSHLSGKN